MSDEPRKLPTLLIALCVIGAMLLYPLSNGPAEWLDWNTEIPEVFRTAINIFYIPLNIVVMNGPESVQNLHTRYLTLWVPEAFDVDFEGPAITLP